MVEGDVGLMVDGESESESEGSRQLTSLQYKPQALQLSSSLSPRRQSGV